MTDDDFHASSRTPAVPTAGEAATSWTVKTLRDQAVKRAKAPGGFPDCSKHFEWAVADLIEALSADREQMRLALEVIAGITSPGHRTFDHLLNDQNYVCDIAREALRSPAASPKEG